ncbi:recombination protein RecR [Candidatus Saccharibacteria bacterium]|nr:recombination protein RecR [Candidatus Saccharibacteria bacterium]
MSLLPRSLEKLIEQLGSIPGVGPRTAERYALAILKKPETDAERIANAITGLHKGLKQCPVTYALIDADQDVSPLYKSPDRDKTMVAVVEDAIDIVALEKTAQYKGTYHVLGGLISPIDGITPDQLHIKQLIDRIKTDQVSELILALNASVEGESTALFIQRQIVDTGLELAITRLARGLPAGLDLEYADQTTLTRALEHRTKLL